jgi:predicted transcriptional regulator
MPQDHRPRSETRKMMINIVATSNQPMTRTQIVNGLNRKKTPHLIDMMDGLVDEGVFSRDVVTFNNGVTGYVYALAQEYVPK